MAEYLKMQYFFSLFKTLQFRDHPNAAASEYIQLKAQESLQK